jgi:hypothetical protein
MRRPVGVFQGGGFFFSYSPPLSLSRMGVRKERKKAEINK